MAMVKARAEVEAQSEGRRREGEVGGKGRGHEGKCKVNALSIC